MKHIFTKAIVCMATLLLTSSLWAQDIIVTTDSKKIEAKILEVSDTEIKYKEKDYLEGPTFVMATNKISSVLYSNGKVVLYNQSPAAEKKEEPQQVQTSVEQPVTSSAPSIDENTAEVLLLSGNTLTVQMTEMKSNYIAYVLNGKSYTMPTSQIEKVTFLINGQVKEYNNKNLSVITNNSLPKNTTNNASANSIKSKRIYSDIRGYVYNDEYISYYEVAEILRNDNKAALKKWKDGENLLISGSVFMGLGVALALSSLYPTIHFAGKPHLQDLKNQAELGIGCSAGICGIIGAGLLIGSLVSYHKALDIYNAKYENTAVTLRWGIAPNGVGLAVAF